MAIDGYFWSNQLGSFPLGCLTALATKSDLYPPVISSGNGQSLINDDLYGQMAFPLPFLITRGDVTFCGWLPTVLYGPLPVVSQR